jgi:hypothetical protein
MNHQQIDHTEIITEIIALVSVIITVTINNIIQCLQDSSSSWTVTHVAAQQDIGSNNTTGQKILMVVPQKQSSSTTSLKRMEDQKKEAGGTKQESRTKLIASSQRSNVSTDSLNSLKTSNSTINHPLMTVEVSPPFMPPLAEDMPSLIPVNSLTIARLSKDC